MEHEFPRTQVRVGWSWTSGEAGGIATAQGWLVTPGLAVANLASVVDADRHWAVVQIEACQVMTSDDLCEACAFAAAGVLAEVPGWDRPVEVIKSDVDTYVALNRAEMFGPCYPPSGIEEATGMRLRVAGHTPGKPMRGPDGQGPGVQMLLPDYMPDPPPEVAKMLVERSREVSEQARRPWYEEG